MIEITIAMSILDSDPQVQQLAVGAVIKGAKPTFEGDNAIYPIEPRYMPLDAAIFLVSKGCSVKNMPLFIESNPSDVVPDGIIGADGSLTWEEWILPNYDVLVRGDRKFIGTNAHTGDDLPLEELLPVVNSLVSPSHLPSSDSSPD